MFFPPFVMGIFFSLFVYHFMVFTGRKDDLSNLYYSLFILTYAIGVGLGAYLPGSRFYNDHLFQILLVLIYCCYGPFFTLFMNSVFVFSRSFLRFFYWFIITAFVFSFVSILISFFVTHAVLLRLPIMVWLVFFITFLFYLLVIIGIKRKNKSRKQKIVLVAILIFICLISYIIFLDVIGSTNYYYSHVTFIIMAFLFAYALTDGFNNEYKKLQVLTEELEEKVIERTAQLEETNKQQMDFFINLAHEMKTPLTLISNYLTSYIKNNRHSPELDVIKYNFEKLKNDMVNFLDIEKLKKKKAFYDHELTANVSLLIESKIELFKSSCQKKQIAIYSQIEKNVYSKIDPLAVDRIINNLVDNAVKYTQEKGSISITLRRDAGKAILMVNDTGIGIAEKELDTIFKSYYQIQHKKRNIQGMGMGLNIVSLLLDDVHGSINVESEVDKGTTFTVTLDACEADNDVDMSRPEYIEPNFDVNVIELSEETFDKNKSTIFLVEDNGNMLAYLQRNLGEVYNVFCARNGKEALEKIRTIPRPKIIVSDIMMDEMDGYEFYYQLSKDDRFKGIPFIFLTAKTSIQDKLAGLKAGAIDYISKPFIIDELIVKIDAILKSLGSYEKTTVTKWGQKISQLLANPDELMNNSDTVSPSVLYKKRTEQREQIYRRYTITPREQEIIELIIEGLENKEIADKLNISLGTVKTHVHKILKKMNITSRIDLVKIILSHH